MDLNGSFLLKFFLSRQISPDDAVHHAVLGACARSWPLALRRWSKANPTQRGASRETSFNLWN